MNCYYLQNLAAYGDTNRVNEIFALAKQSGINTIRTWGFFDSSDSTNKAVIQYAPGLFNENALRALDYVIYKAKQNSIKLIIPLVNNWDDYGGMNQYVEWYARRFFPFEKIISPLEAQNTVIGTDSRRYRKMVSQSIGHDDFYTNSLIRSWYADYVRKILTRVNYYTNIRYSNDPTIMVWELANEPRSSDTSGEIVYQWLQEMAVIFKQIDNKHLVGTGEEGFDIDRNGYENISAFPQWMFNGSAGVSFKKNISISAVDITGIHFYPEAWGLSSPNSFNSSGSSSTWLQSHLRVAGYNQKPLLMGEVGIKRYPKLFYDVVLNSVLYSNTSGVLLWQLGFNGSSYIDDYSFLCENEKSVCNLLSRYKVLFNNKINGLLTPPDSNELIQNFPNPFNDITVITYKVERPQFISLEVYNILGQRVRVLTEDYYLTGEYKVLFDGVGLASGVYQVVMRYNFGFVSKKVILLR